jgi:glycosyltransferase involved in cell wall biosynthesis
MRASQKPFTSVIVPVRNAEGLLPALLEAVAAQDYPAERRELILIDNGSTDGTAGIIRDAEGRGVRGVGEPVQGSYRARDTGVRIASGSILAFTDADCAPRPDWLRQGVQHMEKEGIDVLAGKVTQEVAGRANLYQLAEQIIYLRQAYYTTQGFGATANLFVRRQVFETLGGFDGRLVSSADRILCLDAVRLGYRFGYHDAAVVDHTPRSTARAMAAKEVRLGYGFGQISRLYPRSGGLRFFGQTYLPVQGIKNCLGHEVLGISPVRAVLALAVYSLIRVPCRTYGFLKAALRKP